MKSHTAAAVFSLTAIALITGTAIGQAVFPDTYWGGVPTQTSTNTPTAGYQQDVIGSADVFDLTGFQVNRNEVADTLEVRIYGNYFDDLLAGSSGLYGTQLGDLFISTDGLVDYDTGAATLSDYFQSTDGYTTFEYGVQLGTYTNAGDALDGGAIQSGDIHQITDENTQIGLSWVNVNGVYRAKQEVSLNFAYSHNNEANWYIDDQARFLSITLNDFSGTFGSFEKLGFHWSMTCGNDVIEFEWGNTNPVPEPSAIALLSVVGMIGVIYLRRRVL